MLGSDKMSRDILSHGLSHYSLNILYVYCSINAVLTRNLFSFLKNKNATLRDFKV